ncbi:MAG TPA: tyrosine-type recombinase/integrase [Verrucomicrobiae bacterium]|nr:tyrosine-type recombinase/integrase [Verrucomicrobiae bacterium]
MKRQQIKYLQPEEIKIFLSTLQKDKTAKRSYMMWRIALNTGMRLGELISLNVGQVEGQSGCEVIGKGKKIRFIPLNQEIQEHIKEYLKWKRWKKEDCSFDAPLFLSRVSKRITKQAAINDFKKWSRTAGLKGDFTPHACRHTAATQIWKKTGDLKLIKDLLGHSRISTTDIYTHTTKEDLKRTVEAISI